MHSSGIRTDRRRLVVGAIVALVLLGAGGTVLAFHAGIGASRPDLVLVVWDTCRADRVSANGYPLPTTPRLATFAREAVTFRFCFAPSPWTPPAHASLFTGLLPSDHGLRERLGDRVRIASPLLAGTLRKAGYETVAAPGNPLIGAVGLLDDFETVLPPTPGAAKDSGDLVLARLRGWFTGRRGRTGRRRPLFLFVNLMDCHLPLDPPRADLEAARGSGAAARVPPGGPGIDEDDALAHVLGAAPLSRDQMEVLSIAYDGGVHAADRVTGGILDLLREEGILDGALVAITGDHGECLGEHGELEHRLSIQDAVLHVPLVVRWPGRLEGGRLEDAQVRNQDLNRTLLDAAGARPPPSCGAESVSLGQSPLLPRDAVAEVQPFASFLASVGTRIPTAGRDSLGRLHQGRLALREAATGPSAAKLVVATREDGADGVLPFRRELFDLRSDPGEDRDLLGPGGGPGDLATANRLAPRLQRLPR